MTPDISLIFSLLIAFQIKHFVADFPLQREYMLRKTYAGWGFALPLVTHCAVHATLTLLLILIVKPSLWWLAGVDFAIHFTMDRIKSGPRYLGRFNDIDKPSYWNCFGFDQMVHHLTDYTMIFVLVTGHFPFVYGDY